jgi:hypothetical protein
VDPDELYDDGPDDDEYNDGVNAEIAEQAPWLSPEQTDELRWRHNLDRHVEVFRDGDEDSPCAGFRLDEAGKEKVRREALRMMRWRDPAPAEPPRVRLSSACRPLKAARRVRRHTTRTRAGPGSDPDREPPPPLNPPRAVAL